MNARKQQEQRKKRNGRIVYFVAKPPYSSRPCKHRQAGSGQRPGRAQQKVKMKGDDAEPRRPTNHFAMRLADDCWLRIQEWSRLTRPALAEGVEGVWKESCALRQPAMVFV